MNDQRHHLHLSRPPQGILAKAFAFLLTLALIVVGLMFSVVALAVAAVGGLAFWGWLRWQTRHLRRQMAETPAPAYRQADGIIEGEALRVDEPESPNRRP